MLRIDQYEKPTQLGKSYIYFSFSGPWWEVRTPAYTSAILRGGWQKEDTGTHDRTHQFDYRTYHWRELCSPYIMLDHFYTSHAWHT